VTWQEFLRAMPLIAIVRGVRPDEAVAVGEALFEAGLRCVEVPLNSPEPLDSIRRLAEALGERMLIGAGTVLTSQAVNEVAAAGGRLIVSPNTDAAVIVAAKGAGLISLPAVFTPTEAFAALAAGADALKLFPAEAATPAMLKALLAVLPAGVKVFPVGGIAPGSMAPYLDAGAAGFGIGSAVFKPGQSAEAVRRQAEAFVEAWRSVRR
jgi:2-dehydro-3-deoxyphosphogalactonate aldolase